jgi:hypothetical protein
MTSCGGDQQCLNGEMVESSKVDVVRLSLDLAVSCLPLELEDRYHWLEHSAAREIF